jgi:hypothetical protein
LYPHRALDATNLGIRKGHAGVPGGSHFKATEGRKAMRLLGRVAEVGLLLDTGVAAARVGDRLIHGDLGGAVREVGSFAYDQAVGVVADAASLVKGAVKIVSDPLAGVRETVNALKEMQDEEYAQIEELFGGAHDAPQPPPAPPAVVDRPAPTRPDRGNPAQGLMLFAAAIALAAYASSNPSTAVETPTSETQTSGAGNPAAVPVNPLCQFWTPTGIPFNVPTPCF